MDIFKGIFSAQMIQKILKKFKQKFKKAPPDDNDLGKS